MRGYIKEVLLPVITAGILGGFINYMAIRIDIAVLKNNQAEMKSSLAVIADLQERATKGEAKDDFLQYQIDAINKKDGRTAYNK